MRIVHRSEAGERVAELEIGDPDAPVEDLLSALGASGPATLDGQLLSLDAPLSSFALCEGSVLETAQDQTPATPTARTLAVIGGVRAGVAHPFPLSGTVLVGRGPAAGVQLNDPAVSVGHCSISATEIIDHGSRNGTSVDGHVAPPGVAVVFPVGGIVCIGATRLMLRPAQDDRPAPVTSALGASGGTIPFNRPPRQLPDVDLPGLEAPCEAPEAAKDEVLSVAGILLPIIAGSVIALLFSPLFAVFAALGPVIAIGTWWERRRRNRRDHRRALAELEEQLAVLAAALPVGRVVETGRRRALHPDLAEVVRRAEGPSVHHGPADLAVAVGADDPGVWDWCR